MSAGYFKCWRNGEAMELLLANHNAFILLYVIAYRAQRTGGFNRHNLKPGQALIGDHKNYGMSLQNYRTAKLRLQEAGFATFQATSRGTIATLADTRVFDINADEANKPDNRRITNTQQTPNNYQECKEGKEAGASLKRMFSEQVFGGAE
jgi:hypothetical protein